jgi:hypothetical protein
LRVIPELGQVSEYGTECPQIRLIPSVSQTPRAGFHVAMSVGTEYSSHVFGHDVAGPELADGVGHVGPQPGPVAGPEPSAFAG